MRSKVFIARALRVHLVLPLTVILVAGALFGAVQAAPFSASRVSSNSVNAFAGPWQPLGPQPIVDQRCCSIQAQTVFGDTSGRVTSVAVSPSDPNMVYVGSAGGGIWKTTDGGTHWTPLTDQQASLAIGALSIDSTGQTIYAGTGEEGVQDATAGCQDCQFGQGILKSTDGGQTWTILGQSTFAGLYVGGIAVDRTDGNHILVATNVGLYSSTDGGANWTAPSTRIQVFQVIQDPSNSQTYWATTSDGCATGQTQILTSTNGGSTWNVSYTGAASTGRIALAVSPSAAYAVIATCTGNLQDIVKSTNAGLNWTSLNGSGGYCNLFNVDETNGSACANSTPYPDGSGLNSIVVAIDPNNANNVVFGGETILATTNGGATFTDVGKVYSGGAIHPGFRAVSFFGPSSFYVGNEGGAWKTTDLGGTGTASDWTNLNATLDITQFFRGTSLDIAHLLGGTEDNGTPGHLPGGPTVPGWQDYHGSEGTFTAIDASAQTLFVSHPGLDMERGQWTINPSDPLAPYDSFTPIGPCVSSVCGSETRAYIAPFRMDPTNPQHLLSGAWSVYETMNGEAQPGSVTWSRISPDLTFDTAFSSTHDAIVMIRMGQTTGLTKTVFTASWFGKVYKTTDDFTTSTDITGNLPIYNTANNAYVAWVSDIAFNPSNTQEAWVTMGGVGSQGQPFSHVYHTTNAGAAGGTTWASVDPNQLPNAPATSIQYVPNGSAGTIYVGTYYGVYACSSCGGGSPSPSWSAVGSGLPRAWVYDLTTTGDGYLVAWTHGRGLWSWSIKNRVYLPLVGR